MKAMAQWNDELKQSLINILQSSDRPEDAFDFTFLDGFVRATCCVPDFLSPLNWSGIIFANQEPNFKDEVETSTYHSALFALFNHHLDEVLEGECKLPVDPIYHDDVEKRAELEKWCDGFLTGYYLYQEIWDEMLAAYPDAEVDTDIKLEPLADQIESLLVAIKSILDPESDLASGLSLQNVKESFEVLPEHISLFGLIGQALLSAESEDNVDEKFEEEYQQALDESEEDLFAEFESFQPQEGGNIPSKGDMPFIRDTAKIGRNDPCPCGSGKKFKKCCLH